MRQILWKDCEFEIDEKGGVTGVHKPSGASVNESKGSKDVNLFMVKSGLFNSRKFLSWYNKNEAK